MVFNETGALRGRSANDFFLPPLGRVGEDRGAERAGLRRRVGLHPPGQTHFNNFKNKY